MLLLGSNSPIKTVQNDAPHEVGVAFFRVRDFAPNSIFLDLCFWGVDGEGTTVRLWTLWQPASAARNRV